MPGKSRQGKSKRSSLARRRKERQRYLATATPPPVAAEAPNSASLSNKAAPKASVPISSATPITARYPYIGGELLRIGILAGIILVVLFVLALVLAK